VIEQGWLRAVHPKDEDRVREQWDRAVAARSLFQVEYRFQLPTGTASWVLGQAAPEVDDRGDLVGYVGTVTDISDRVRSETRLKKSFQKLRSLASRLQTVREEERTEISREVHDSLGQALTALSFDLAWLEGKLPADFPALLERCRSMQVIVEDILRTTQRLCMQLRPHLLDNLGLAAAIEWQLQEFENRTHIACRFHKLDETGIGQESATAAFRILQEALTNVARHAQANAVEVRLLSEPGHLVLEISDNGKGIADADLSSIGSIGILGMKERTLALGGELYIKGCPGKGTTVTLRIPCPGNE
jgi:signal transduction histidine kinase